MNALKTRFEFDCGTEAEITVREDVFRYDIEEIVGRVDNKYVFVDWIREVRSTNSTAVKGTVLQPITVGQVKHDKKKIFNEDSSPYSYLYGKRDVSAPWEMWIKGLWNDKGCSLAYNNDYTGEYKETVKEYSLIDEEYIGCVVCVERGNLYRFLEQKPPFDKVFNLDLYNIITRAASEDSVLGEQ